jgi:transglutaminase-like putative cysteine protease
MNSGSDERTAMAAAAATLLTALTLSPLVRGHTWLFVAAITVVTVMVTGIIARQAVRWWPAVVLSQAVVLLFALVLLFARARVLEGPGVIGVLIDLFRDGMDVTRTQAPPVEATPGIVLVVAGSTGLVALLVDLLAVTLRQPALAGLPLLAVYCVPAALLTGGLPWMYFLIAAAGFLLLLSADSVDRIRGWGRVLTSSANAAPSSGGRSTMTTPRGGARIAAMTVAVAVLLPALVPGLNNQIFGNGDGDGDGEGGRTITRINPILTLRNDLTQTENTPLLRYRTDVSDPDPLRIVTADKFDGKTWSPGAARISSKNDATAGLPPPPGLNNSQVQTVASQTNIQTLGLKETYLPLPYPSTRVRVDGDWLYDAGTLNVISGRKGQTTENLRYSVDHLEVKPTAEQLADAPQAPLAELSAYLSYPADLDPYIAATARDVAGDGTPYEQAVRLQRWFRSDGQFVYSTDAPPVGKSDGSSAAVLAFLRDKRGYCVHFASSMALMARLLNIPARVAVGFLPGERISENVMQISAHDAHAWPELYFEGAGWVRFEPTPRSGLTTQPDWTIPPSGSPAAPSASESTTTDDSSQPSASASAGPQRRIDEGVAAKAGDQGFAVPWRLVLVLALVLVALALPLLASVYARRRRFALLSPAEAAWDELRIGLRDLGVRWAVSWTPRAVEARLASEYPLSPAAVAGLHRLVGEIEETRYAPPSADLGRPAGERQADVSAVITSLAAPLPTWRRTLLRVFPPSGLAVLSGIGPRVNAAADRATSQVREKVGGRR